MCTVAIEQHGRLQRRSFQAEASAQGKELTALLSESTLQEFRSHLTGDLLQPADGGYDVARKVYNVMKTFLLFWVTRSIYLITIFDSNASKT